MSVMLARKPIAGPIRGSGGGGGKGGGGGSSGAATEDPNTLQSDTTARVLDLISAGPCLGLVNGANSIFFDDTELADTSGNYNFLGISWDHREGDPDQDYMAGFAEAEEEIVENVQVFNGTPIVRTLAGPIDACRVSIEIPELTFQDPDTGNLHGTSVEFQISIRPSGTSTYTDLDPITINGKCVSPFEQSYRVELGGSTDWDVKVTRLTGDSGAINLQNQTFWATTTLITDGKFKYPNCGYLGYTIDAQQFGSSIPTRSADWYGILCDVPSNYDPNARTYTGIWDGTFKQAWTDNPAWVLYYLLTNVPNALGKFIDESNVDKFALYAIAQYCDALIPDGFGGTEPRYTFNYQIMSMADAYKVIQNVASVFRGLTFWGTGLVRVIADMPADPVKLVTPSNIKDGLFTYEGVAFSARHSVALVTWYDPQNQCRPTIELVEDQDLIAELGWKPLQLTAYACTSRGQAHRMGKWALDTEKFATQTVNYEAGYDHADLVPGDVIEVYDPDYQGVPLAGRISSCNSNSVTIDRNVVIDGTSTYTLRVIYPDGTLDSKVLNNTAATTNVLTFDDALSQTPINAAVWGLQVSNLDPRQFRVLSVKEGSDGFFMVSALFYDPTKYDRVEQNIKIDPPTYSNYTNVTVPSPVNLTCKQYVYRSNGVALPSATFSWTASDSSVPVNGFQIQLQPPNQNWGDAIDLRGPSYDIEGVVAGLWNVRVRAIGFNGVPSGWTTLQVLLNSSPDAPEDVTNFAMALTGQTALLSWDQSTAPDIDHYLIKFAPVITGADWSSAVVMQDNISGANIHVPAMIGTYLIKAISHAGVESINAGSVVTTAAALAGFYTVATLDDAPTWGGTKTNTTVVSGVLKLTTSGGAVSPSGSYQSASYYDLGDVYTVRLLAQVTAAGEDISDVMSTWPNLASVATLGGADPGNWNISLLIRTTNDDPSGTPTWSAWKPFLAIGDYTCRAFEYQAAITSNNQNVNVDLSDLAIIVAMPKRTETLSGLTTLTTGELAVSISPKFYGAIKSDGTIDTTQAAFVFTPHDAASGDRVSISTKTTSGCNLSNLNSGGTRTAVTGDMTISGIGYGT